VDIACTIRAVVPGTVTIVPVGSQVDTTLAPPAGAAAHPVGLAFDASNAPSALQNGATFALDYLTIATGFAAIFASQELATLTIPGLHAQTQWLGGLGLVNLGVVLADAQGRASASWPIPAGTRLIDQPLWVQGVTGFSLPCS
jgi:hypothetical protein